MNLTITGYSRPFVTTEHPDLIDALATWDDHHRAWSDVQVVREIRANLGFVPAHAVGHVFDVMPRDVDYLPFDDYR